MSEKERTIHFKLKNGELFEFIEYKGRFRTIEDIDNLIEIDDSIEKESKLIISVFDDFKIDDFIETQFNYNRFIKVIELINKIREEKYKMSDLDFIEIKPYDLSNPLFSWLSIDENNLEKQFNFFLENFPHLGFGKGIYSDKINYCCEKGLLEVAQLFYNSIDNKIDEYISNKEHIFLMACKNNYIEVAKWIYSISREKRDLNIHIYSNLAFHIACQNGYLEFAKWLYSLGGFKKGGFITYHENVDKWLKTLP